MGRPAPGYIIRLLDPDGAEAEEGEIAIALDPAPTPLMQGYFDDSGALRAPQGSAYRTGDVALRNPDGSLTYVGRADDVFKSSGYRISPFELESVLVEHDAVAEAAVVPSPDQVRTALPKAFIALAEGHRPTPPPRPGSSTTSAPGSRPINASVASNSTSCRRRSPARSGAWTFAGWKRPAGARRQRRVRVHRRREERG